MSYIHHGNRAIFFGRGVHELAVRRDGYAFRFAADFDGLCDFSGRDVNKTDTGNIFVRDEQGVAILTHIKILRVGTAVNDTYQFVLGDIKTPMPSALLSAGGKVLSSTPGGAMGEPLKAT